MDATPEISSEQPLNHSWVELLLAVARCGRTAQRVLTAQLGEQFSASQAAVLWACRELAAAEPSQLELAAHLGISAAQVSALVEALRREGLLESERSPHDRRRQTWRLTDHGQRRLSELDEQLAAWAAKCCQQFGSHKLSEIARGLHALAQLLDGTHAASATDAPRRRAA